MNSFFLFFLSELFENRILIVSIVVNKIFFIFIIIIIIIIIIIVIIIIIIAHSLLHVVAGFQQYLDHFTWRHDSILNFIASHFNP